MIRDIETGRPLTRMNAGETVLRDLDLSDVLDADDTIASIDSATATRQGHVSGSILPTITTAMAGAGSTTAQLRIAGGTAGEVYNVDVALTTAAGESRTVRLAVEVR